MAPHSTPPNRLPRPRVADVPPAPARPDADPPPNAEDRYSSASHRACFRVLWHVDLAPLPELPHFLYPTSVAMQETNNPRYCAEGRLRAGQDFCYFCYTLEGVGGFRDHRGLHHMGPGDAFITEIADPRTCYFFPGVDRRPWRFIAINFGGMAARGMVRDMVDNFGSCYHLPLQARIIQRLLRFGTTPYSTMHLHGLDAAEVMLELLLALGADARAREEPDQAMTAVKRALEIMASDLELGLNVSGLARRLGVSREYLCRVFQRCLQRSPKALLQEMRMRRAGFLLKDTEMPVKEVARRLGYSDYTNFIRAFKQEMGMPPMEFRRCGSIPLPQPLFRHLQGLRTDDAN